jgi:hypothetical protein
MDRLKNAVKKVLKEMSMTGGGTAGAKTTGGIGIGFSPATSFKKKKLKEASSYKEIDGSFDTALQWIWFFGGKELLQNKLGIYSTSQNYFRFKKAMEDGKITIQDLDKATKGEYGQTGGIPFSQTAVWKQDIKPYLDRVKQDKINDLNIDLEEIKTPYGTGNLGPGPKATEQGVKDNYYVKAFGFKPVNRKKQAKASKAIDYKDLWGATYK